MDTAAKTSNASPRVHPPAMKQLLDDESGTKAPEKTPVVQFGRWLAAGMACAGVGLLLLKLLAGMLGWPYALTTLITSEVCTLLNFFMVDSWVFGHVRPNWKRLGQYHLANAVGLGVGWISANALQLAGVHYLLASLLGTVLASGFSIFTNFFWIWRKPNTLKSGKNVPKPSSIA